MKELLSKQYKRTPINFIAYNRLIFHTFSLVFIYYHCLQSGARTYYYDCSLGFLPLLVFIKLTNVI